MKAFLDSDVLLDFLTARKPFVNEIKRIMHLGISGDLHLNTSSLIIANIHYFISKSENKKQALTKIDKLTSFINILNVGEKEIKNALRSSFKDFEDAIQSACAANSEMDVIVTRNTKVFKASPLAILTPIEFLKSLEA